MILDVKLLIHVNYGGLFAVKDEIFCLFEGALDRQTDNLGSLKQEYGLAKSENDQALLMIEAYQALIGDRAPCPPNLVVGHLHGNFVFIAFDKSTSTLFVATVSNQNIPIASFQKFLFNYISCRTYRPKIPLYWGITADDADLLKGACGKSLASFPQGCFFPMTVGELQSYENRKHKITVVPAKDEEIWGLKFMVKDVLGHFF